MQHFILENAKRYNNPSSDPVPKGAFFDDKKGYWRDNESGEALITSGIIGKLNSKKADRETGEDQKGE